MVRQRTPLKRGPAPARKTPLKRSEQVYRLSASGLTGAHGRTPETGRESGLGRAGTDAKAEHCEISSGTGRDAHRRGGETTRKPIKRNVRPKAKRTGKPRRVSVLRCRPYLDWLQERRCVACILKPRGFAERAFVDPAHGPVNGRSSKGADNEAIPLCRHHHDEQHRIGWPAFASKYGIDRAQIAAEHYARYLEEKR